MIIHSKGGSFLMLIIRSKHNVPSVICLLTHRYLNGIQISGHHSSLHPNEHCDEVFKGNVLAS